MYTHLALRRGFCATASMLKEETQARLEIGDPLIARPCFNRRHLRQSLDVVPFDNGVEFELYVNVEPSCVKKLLEPARLQAEATKSQTWRSVMKPQRCIINNIDLTRSSPGLKRVRRDYESSLARNIIAPHKDVYLTRT